MTEYPYEDWPGPAFQNGELIPLTLFLRHTCRYGEGKCGPCGAEFFVIRGMVTLVISPNCLDWQFGGRVRNLVDAIQDQTGVRMLHEKDAYGYFNDRAVGGPWRHGHPLDSARKAYYSTWTRYLDAADVERITELHTGRCSFCDTEISRSTPQRFQTDSILEGWFETYGGRLFCSRLCEWSHQKEIVKEYLHGEREKKWLKQGKKLLLENRRLLRDHFKPAPQEACRSRPKG